MRSRGLETSEEPRDELTCTSYPEIRRYRQRRRRGLEFSAFQPELPGNCRNDLHCNSGYSDARVVLQTLLFRTPARGHAAVRGSG